jgi:hypothetical protein
MTGLPGIYIYHKITEAVPGLDDRIAEELYERIVKHYLR